MPKITLRRVFEDLALSAFIVNVKDICSIVPTAVWKWQNRFNGPDSHTMAYLSAGVAYLFSATPDQRGEGGRVFKKHLCLTLHRPNLISSA